MSFVAKEWKDRLVEFAGRRKLMNVSTGEETTVDVSRAEGEVSQSGDAFSAANMNDLEQRIKDEFDQVNSDLTDRPSFITDESGKITGYKTKVGADTVFPFNSIEKIVIEKYTLGGTSGIQAFQRTFDIGTDDYSGYTVLGILSYEISGYSVTNLGFISGSISGSTLTLTLSANGSNDSAVKLCLAICRTTD